jgi:hypothetical protein
MLEGEIKAKNIANNFFIKIIVIRQIAYRYKTKYHRAASRSFTNETFLTVISASDEASGIRRV